MKQIHVLILLGRSFIVLAWFACRNHPLLFEKIPQANDIRALVERRLVLQGEGAAFEFVLQL